MTGHIKIWLKYSSKKEEYKLFFKIWQKVDKTGGWAHMGSLCSVFFSRDGIFGSLKKNFKSILN